MNIIQLQKITLVLFLICGAISLIIRLRRDISTGSAMLGKSDWDKTQEKARKLDKRQLVFSILTIIFLIFCVLLGVGRTYGWL